jgi:hypothetical protein
MGFCFFMLSGVAHVGAPGNYHAIYAAHEMTDPPEAETTSMCYNRTMTTMALLDTLAEANLGPAVSDVETMPLKAALARDLIGAALADLARIHEYERMLLAASAGEPLTLAMRESTCRLFTGWEGEAAQVAARVRAVVHQGAALPELSRLDDALGSTRARLTVTPAQIASAVDQVKQGRSIPARELRDELHARLRA